MSSQDYEPTRVAQLIEQFRESSGLSVRKAASMAEISEGRWRQIAKGYQQATKDVRVPVNAPAETLARMAIAVGMRSGHFHAGRDYHDDSIDELSREIATIVSKAEKNIPEDSPVFGGSYDDPNYLANVEGWLRELQDRIEDLEAKVAELSLANKKLTTKKNHSLDNVVDLSEAYEEGHNEDTEPEQKSQHAAFQQGLGEGIGPDDIYEES